MLSDIINPESLGYAFVVCGLFLSVAFYVVTIAYGVHRLEKSVESLKITINKSAKPIAKKTTKPKTMKGTKNANKKQ